MQKHKCQRVSTHTGPASWNAKKHRERVLKRRLIWCARALQWVNTRHARSRRSSQSEVKARVELSSPEFHHRHLDGTVRLYPDELSKRTLYQTHDISTPLVYMRRILCRLKRNARYWINKRRTDGTRFTANAPLMRSSWWVKLKFKKWKRVEN